MTIKVKTTPIDAGQPRASNKALEESPLAAALRVLHVSSAIGSNGTKNDKFEPKTHVPYQYQGLVMQEKKCIDMVKHHTFVPIDESNFGWQLLVARHTQLIQQHCEFYLACQPRSADAEANKVDIKLVKRMWEHGMEGCLGILRSGLPASEEAMGSFIKTALAKMSFLVENVPGLELTWMNYIGTVFKSFRPFEAYVDNIDLARLATTRCSPNVWQPTGIDGVDTLVSEFDDSSESDDSSEFDDDFNKHDAKTVYDEDSTTRCSPNVWQPTGIDGVDTLASEFDNSEEFDGFNKHDAKTVYDGASTTRCSPNVWQPTGIDGIDTLASEFDELDNETRYDGNVIQCSTQ